MADDRYKSAVDAIARHIVWHAATGACRRGNGLSAAATADVAARVHALVAPFRVDSVYADAAYEYMRGRSG